MVIYVDVLFVVNFFITYLLLLFTRLVTKSDAKSYRLLLSAFVGGCYSLVILADELHFMLNVLFKILISAVLVIVAFGFKRVLFFAKTMAIFYFSNMLFLGVIFAVWLAFKPGGVVINNDTVYFDISAKILLLSAGAAYAISVLIIKIHNRTSGKGEIYTLTVFKGEEKITLFAFADSGNKLKEPFSDYPVIIADSSKISFETERIIPYNTVGGEGLLKAFKPDKVVISSGGKSYETRNVYIAMSEIDSKEFSAILNTELLNI